MIPLNYIKDWAQKKPWQEDEMVEQDLIISKVLVEIYSSELIRNTMLFRGGTALNTIFLKSPYRYSEDIDLSRMKKGGIGKEIDEIRNKLDSWLGTPKRMFTPTSVKLTYQYKSVNNTPKKIKIEINIEESICFKSKEVVFFSVKSPWYEGKSAISTFHINELMATKLRALYQRKKGRDLFDLYYVLKDNMINSNEVIDIFLKYMDHEGNIIRKKEFIENMEDKKQNVIFREDVYPLLPHDIALDFEDAYNSVMENLILNIPE